MQVKKTLPFLIIFIIFSLLLPALTSASPRIVGGGVTKVSKFPSVVSLQDRAANNGYWGHICGGTLIRPRWVLTTAHCVDSNTARDLDVVLGRTNLRTRSGERIAVGRIFIHQNSDIDVALLYLVKASRQKTAPLLQTPADNTVAFGVGWGAKLNSFPAALQSVSLPIIPDADCSDSYKWEFDPSIHICAGYKTGKRDTCQGDSGGPLYIKGALAGITSFGSGCGRPGFPGVYVKIDTIISWIKGRISIHPYFKSRKPGKEPGGVPKPILEVSDNFGFPNDLNPFWDHSSFIYSNYHISDLRIRLIGGTEPYCIDGICYRPGQWFKPTLDSGRRSASFSFSTLTPCPVLQFWAKLNRPFKSRRIKNSDLIKSGKVGLYISCRKARSGKRTKSF